MSNYTGPISQANLQAWRDDGVELVIVQAFPPEYSQYQIQQQQIQACSDFGMPFECYIYDYLSVPSWRDRALVGIQALAWQPAQVWADEEDTTAKVMPLKRRIDAVAATLTAIEAAGFDTGVYTGAWFWTGYMGNTPAFRSYPLWDALYDGDPNLASDFTPYGGWTQRTIKQYRGTSTLHGVGNVDLDVT